MHQLCDITPSGFILQFSSVVRFQTSPNATVLPPGTNPDWVGTFGGGPDLNPGLVQLGTGIFAGRITLIFGQPVDRLRYTPAPGRSVLSAGACELGGFDVVVP